MHIGSVLICLVLVRCISCKDRCLLQASTTPGRSVTDPIWEEIRKQKEPLLANRSEDDAVRYIYQHHPDVLSFGNEGRKFLDEVLEERAREAETLGHRLVLMEIGIWLGASAARWLNVHPNIALVGIDPFLYPSSNGDTVKGVPPEYRKYFDHKQFNRRLAEYEIEQESNANEDRYLVLTGFSPSAAAATLRIPRAKVGAFYIDGGKVDNKTQFTEYLSESLETFYANNPAAIFSGDDWVHDTTPTLQSTLKAFAAAKLLQLVQSEGRTWVMGKNLASLDAVKRNARNFKWEIKDPAQYRGPTVAEIIRSTIRS